MTPFYAYLISTTNVAYRWYLTFASREAADEWWRFVSTHSSYADIFERTSPIYYAYDSNKVDVNNTPVFLYGFAKMFPAWVADNQGRNTIVIPQTKIVDHISGKWYFLRSADDPRRHWYTRLSGRCLVCREEACDAVHVSTEYRTRFRVGVHNPAFKAPKDFVMIGSDEVSIAASKDYIVRIDDAEELKTTKVYQIASSHLLFLFKDIKDRFVTRTEEMENGDIREYVVPVERGLGEAWELAD